MKKNLYINLVPIIVGGGLQNAMNFLMNLNHKEFYISNTIVVIRQNVQLEKICKAKGYKYIIINNTLLARLKYELLFFINKRESIIFTLFGTKPILSWGAKTITGCAYSNLFYPKIDFWGYLTPVKKTIKKLKDLYRYFNVKSSDVVIFETDLLTKKAIEEFSFPKVDTYTVKMAVSSMVKKGDEFIDFGIKNDKFNILYLGSAHPNKRQHLLPEIVQYMLDSGLDNFCFITTMNETHSYTKEVLNVISKKNLDAYIVNLGPVDNFKVANLIEQCDAMINIARLESFSNNFVEAWQMEKVLFVTDDEWAKDSCGDAAVYLDIDDKKSLSLKIKNVMEDKSFYNNIIEKGRQQLDSYPNSQEKISQFVEIINKYSTEGTK